jgi:hypothetical protein
VFENRVLRKIFGPKRGEVTVEWKELHNEKIYALYSSLNIVLVIKSRLLKWAAHVKRMGEKSGLYRGLAGKLEGKSPLGRTRCRFEYYIRMDLLEVRCGGMDWIVRAQYRDRWRVVLNAVVKLRVQ